jgi:hypothetical protein
MAPYGRQGAAAMLWPLGAVAEDHVDSGADAFADAFKE